MYDVDLSLASRILILRLFNNLDVAVTKDIAHKIKEINARFDLAGAQIQIDTLNHERYKDALLRRNNGDPSALLTFEQWEQFNKDTQYTPIQWDELIGETITYQIDKLYLSWLVHDLVAAKDKDLTKLFGNRDQGGRVLPMSLSLILAIDNLIDELGLATEAGTQDD